MLQTVHDIAAVTGVCPDAKYSQMTSTQTMVGINRNAIFRIDPRLAGNKRVESETFAAILYFADSLFWY